MLNHIHMNNATRISLNDRFTILQSVRVPEPSQPSVAPIMRRAHSRSRSRSQSRSRSVGRMAPQQHISPMRSPRSQGVIPAARSRLARHYEDVMERHQPARAPQPMRLKPAIRNISTKQRLALAMANRGPAAMTSMRGMRRPMDRPSRAVVATMHMDRMAASVSGRRAIRGRLTTALSLRQKRLNRAIATVHQAQQQLNRQRSRSASGQRVSRMDLVRSMDKANLIRQRSRSRSRVNMAVANGNGGSRRSRSRSLGAARSQSNLRRSNSRLNLRQSFQQQQPQQPARRKLNRDFQQRSRSRSRQNTPSIASRLGVRPGANGNGQGGRGQQQQQQAAGGRRQRQRSNSVSSRLGGGQKQALNRVAQGKISKQQRLGGQRAQANNITGRRNQNNRQGGNQVARGRNNKAPVSKKNIQALAGGAGKRGKKVSALQQRLQRPGQQKPKQQQQGQQGQGKGKRGKRGNRPVGGPKKPLKKEDLDKELDKYMSSNN